LEAEPEASNIEPEFPFPAEPLVTKMTPEVPDEGALPEANVKDPDELLELVPPRIETEPPV